MRHLLIFALICTVALTAAAIYVPDMVKNGPKPRSAPTLTDLENRANSLQRKIALMEQTADRYAQWKTCVSLVPINEVGDTDNRFGYTYDERDGTKQTYMSALVVNREDERPEYAFLKFARREGCESQPTQPGGTAEDASVDGLDTIRTDLAAEETATSRQDRVLALERKVRRLKERAEDLERMSERFDQCMFTIGVTQYGKRDGTSGYVYGDRGLQRRQALAMDMRGSMRHDTISWPSPARSRPSSSATRTPGAKTPTSDDHPNDCAP